MSIAGATALLGACGLAGDGASPGPTSGSEAPSPTSSPPPPTELDIFRAQCEEGLQNWKPSAGQLSYPQTLDVDIDQPTIYNAAIDVSDAPLPPDRVITVPGGEATSEPIMVKCAVAARLIPVGDLTVNPTEDSWITREFPPSGVVEWAWSVRTPTPSDKQLILELQPVQLGNGVPLTGGSESAEVFTQVTVTATSIDRVSYWFATQWPKVVGVASILSVAILGVLGFMGRLSWPPWKKSAKGTDRSAGTGTAPDDQVTATTPPSSG